MSGAGLCLGYHRNKLHVTDSLSFLKTANASQLYVRLTCNQFCMKT